VTGWALGLILTAAFVHASWNLLNKRASGHASFTWLVAASSALLYAPVVAAVAVLGSDATLSLTAIGFITGSAVLHTAYFVLLNEGYRAGDLSLVYPLARGTGPLLSTVVAIAFFGERPSLLAVSGGLLIVLGVVVLTSNTVSLHSARPSRAVNYALVTGAFIAAYTLWDKQAVATYAVAPVVLDWGANLGRTLLLTPFALRHWSHVREEWRAHRFEALGMALLVPLSYILVLMAMQFTPVSYVAPAREISILIGTIMGTRFLAEGDAPRRLAGATAMVLGVVALALG
jgi:drug/metabolite transporter (DMT)-like permease